MAKEIKLAAFALHSLTHQSPGLWRHPRDRSLEYKSLRYWVDLAKILEQWQFDAIFIADSLSVYQIYGGSLAPTVKYAIQVPRIDPILTISAMANVTGHLGFGVTSNAIFEPPYQFGRRMTTLDHLTEGRIGWNIVTGHSVYGARAVGQELLPHDDRYAVTDEYLELLYKLWEGSWDDDAVVADRATGVYADPDKVRRVVHHGEHFRLEGIHLAEPSPQRTPVLFQAGTSSRGRRFAARHAECIFVSGPSARALAPGIADIRRLAVEAGREAADVAILAQVTAIVGETEEEAQAKLADYRQYINPEAAIVMFSGQTGIDLSGHDPAAPILHRQQTQGIFSMLEAFTVSDPTRVWTLAELAEKLAIGGSGPVFVGTPDKVADAIEAFLDESDADGLNLSYAITPGDYEDFGRLVVPELRRRGRFKAQYRPGTLREKLFGAGARLPGNHPASEARP